MPTNPNLAHRFGVVYDHVIIVISWFENPEQLTPVPNKTPQVLFSNHERCGQPSNLNVFGTSDILSLRL
ncbi:MAG: hypothetical protein WC648_03520, partial [Candidatus Paceibacterota bacterium]